MAGINMADFPKNRHIILAINIPPKVLNDIIGFGKRFRYMDYAN